jgi:transcriptional regulator with XRE-family HTH domain
VSDVEKLEPDLRFLGEAIREIREQRGLSPGELASAIGVSRARLVALEEGRVEPDYLLLVAVSKGLGGRTSIFLRAEELAAKDTVRVAD